MAGVKMRSADLLALLVARGETVAFCESLTAGLAAATLADTPGSSAALRGGLVTYATEVKSHFTGVPVAVLEAQGVVSAATARVMAHAAVRETGADWGVSLTGVAGPDLQEGKAPGTVYIGIWNNAANDGQEFAAVGLGGTRAEIRRGAVDQAFDFLAECLAAAPVKEN
ncbi:competence/damage-inducible protein CinA domain protein [Corynebacterium sp. DNF00584]|nr:competence/damage-inducible protein CinA domain protein [Corynebacterium sp. DNF00584]